MDTLADIAYAQILDDRAAGIARTALSFEVDKALTSAASETSTPDRKTWGRTPRAQAGLQGLQGFVKS